MIVHYLGAPGPAGGANTEAGHTFAVLRKHLDLDLRIIPSWEIGNDTRKQLESIGCKVVSATAATLHAIPDLAGSIVWSMCNARAWEIYPILKQLRCRTIWSNCMNFLFPAEEAMTKAYGPCDAYHFQSSFQKTALEAKLLPLGYIHSKGHLIRGAFDFDAIPFAPRPHKPGEEFVIGRLSRADLDKVSSNLWPILSGVPYDHRKALIMAWSPAIEKKCGKPPAWATVMEVNKIPVRDFLPQCHAMLGLNGGASENHPRIGLESMAAGVPLVVQRLGGWPEMIQHEKTGFICDGDSDMKFYLALLARDESLRQQIIQNAREHVRELACPERIAAQWKSLFESLASSTI